MKDKKYRFFFHYNKQHKKMSVHYKKQCLLVDDIQCNVVTETKWNKQQPLVVIQGFANEVKIKNNTVIIN